MCACVYVSECVSICVCVPEGWEARLGQMVHKGVTAQWVGTAIDALQHPRRWNIWLLTRSQNSLALPSPYLAAAREPMGDLVGINTTQNAALSHPQGSLHARVVHWKLPPWFCKEVMMVVQSGRMSAQSHGDEQRQHTGTLGYCYTWMIWPWAYSEGPLLAKQLRMTWFLEVTCNTSILFCLAWFTEKHWRNIEIQRQKLTRTSIGLKH